MVVEVVDESVFITRVDSVRVLVMVSRAVAISDSVARMVVVDDIEIVIVSVMTTDSVSNPLGVTVAVVEGSVVVGAAVAAAATQPQAEEMATRSLLQLDAYPGRAPTKRPNVRRSQNVPAKDSCAVRPRAQASTQEAITGEAPIKPTRAKALNRILSITQYMEPNKEKKWQEEVAN